MIGLRTVGRRGGLDAGAETEPLTGRVLVPALLTTLLLQLVAMASATATTAVVHGTPTPRAVRLRRDQLRRARPARPTFGRVIASFLAAFAAMLPSPSDIPGV